MKNLKKKLLILLAIVAAIVLIGFIVLKIMTKNAERHVETEKGIGITAAQLVAAYTASEDSANKAYLNKTLQLTGTVASVDTNGNHQSVILLKEPGAMAGVLCTFKKKEPSIKPGAIITCKGICTGFLSNVTLTDGILLHTTGAMPTGSTTIKANDTVRVNSNTDTPIPTTKAFITTKAKIEFDAGGGVEDIKAVNNQVEASITPEGTVKFKVAILGFKFSDALMQQHFNDSYLESKKYPTASFEGTITNIRDIDWLKLNATYTANVTGRLTMHGVTQKVSTAATLTRKNGSLAARASLELKMEDYKISTDATSSAELTVSANF